MRSGYIDPIDWNLISTSKNSKIIGQVHFPLLLSSIPGESPHCVHKCARLRQVLDNPLFYSKEGSNLSKIPYQRACENVDIQSTYSLTTRVIDLNNTRHVAMYLLPNMQVALPLWMANKNHWKRKYLARLPVIQIRF